MIRTGRFLNNKRLEQASLNKPTLKQGETNDAVKIVQMALIDLGFAMPRSTGNGKKLPDGIFGEETFRTISEFQRLSGLLVDGIVGANTIDKLETRLIELNDQESAEVAADIRRKKPTH